MNNRQTAAVELRESVLAIVAHDIRSPLATISMAATLLDDVEISRSQQSHFLEMIRRSCAHIDKLIRDLVDVAHIESGSLALDRFPTDVGTLLADVADLHRPAAQQAGLSLNLVMPRTSVTLDLDRDRIIELLGNLITNAIKFTPSGGTVTLLCLPGPTDVTLAIADTGVGIEQEQLAHVFERFWQAHHARRAGAGLGLAICKGIADAHGGTMRVVSELGGGSTFYVVLPR